jgi:hypothetical protein
VTGVDSEVLNLSEMEGMRLSRQTTEIVLPSREGTCGNVKYVANMVTHECRGVLIES